MWITIDRDSPLTLTRQIYDRIKQMILDGALASGASLPATRKLSGELEVSRNIILDVYNQLIAEGYLTARHGSGTIVAEGLDVTAQKSSAGSVGDGRSAPVNKQDPPKIDFRSGVPALDLFPYKEWGRLYQEVCHRLPPSGFGYCGAAGVRELREQIARYLFRTRGISCSAGRIIITSGSTQGLSLISRLLGKPDHEVIVEEPSHAGLRGVIIAAGCSVRGIAADAWGLDTAQLEPDAPVSFVYTTPSHQYPLGSILPIRRRLDLVRYAQENDCYIVEDDYDTEFRYEGAPVSALYELDPERVIYLGSFSKLLAPGIRLGFMIVPDSLLTACKTLKVYSDVHTDALTQHTLARFIEDGSFERHIWKMKKHYRRLRSHMLQMLEQQFADRFEVLGQASGLHIVVRFRDVEFTRQLVRAAAARGIAIYPVENYFLNRMGLYKDGIIMGYSHLTPERIAEGIEILKGVIDGRC